MLNIENYDQWKAVCDDDELIQMLYDEGVRPGTDKFMELLGTPYEGEPANPKDILVLWGAIGVSIAVVYGSVKLIKYVTKKTKQKVNKIFSTKEEEES